MTIVEFSKTYSSLVSGSKILGAALGDVPTLLPINQSLSVHSRISCREHKRGIANEIQEVQKLSIKRDNTTNSYSPGGFIPLKYKKQIATIPLNIPDSSLSQVLTDLVGANVLVSNTGSLDNDHNSWMITFPVNYGRAHLITIQSCSSQVITEGLSYTLDAWQGSSCMLNGGNIFTSLRIVAGYSKVIGHLNLYLENKLLGAISINNAQFITDQLSKVFKANSLEPSVSVLNSNSPELILILIDFKIKKYFNFLVISEALFQPDMCLLDFTSSKEYPCSFPFISQGYQYSMCLPSDHRTPLSSEAYCSTNYNLDVELGTFGLCKPCSPSSSQIIVNPSVSIRLLPLFSSLGWFGSPSQIEETLSSLIYISRPNPYLVSETYYSKGVDLNLTDLVYFELSSSSSKSSERQLLAFDSLSIESAPVKVSPKINVQELSQSLYGLEDSLLYISNINVLINQQSATLKDDWNYLQRLTVKINVLHGDIFLSSHKGLYFNHENITGSLTFSGSYYDINNALVGLVYLPQKDWNSVSSGVNIESSIHTFTIYKKIVSEYQVLKYLYLYIANYLICFN